MSQDALATKVCSKSVNAFRIHRGNNIPDGHTRKRTDGMKYNASVTVLRRRRHKRRKVREDRKVDEYDRQAEHRLLIPCRYLVVDYYTTVLLIVFR